MTNTKHKKLTKHGKAVICTTIITAIIFVIIVLLVNFGLDSYKSKKFDNEYNQEITELLQENERLGKTVDVKEYPQEYQEKQIKKIKNFTKNHKETSEQQEKVLYALAYNNSDDYQNVWYNVH